MKKILVIDGNSIINRAFYAGRPLTTKSGKYTNAIYGMVNMIKRQLDAVKPDYAAVAFDIKHPTFRHKIFDGYKQGRHPTPPELLSQFDDAKECLTLMGFAVMELPGWEADDIQGTIAKMAHTGEEFESYVFSGDRDLLQLIDDKVTILLATNDGTVAMHRDEFFQKYSVEPTQFVDMKALMGDSSDNIPGVPGIGEKTAATLIQNFGTLEGIYENIEDSRITKGVRAKLEAGRESAFLSRTLAKIDTDAPVGTDLSGIAYKGFDKFALHKKFTELEFNSLVEKWGLDQISDDDAHTAELECSEREYKCATPDEIVAAVGNKFAIDLLGDAIYISCGDSNFKYEGALADITNIFRGSEIICYDGKSLWHKLNRSGIDLSDTTLLDLMLYEYVINPGGNSAGVRTLLSMFMSVSILKDMPAAHAMQDLEAVLRKRVEEDGLSKILFELEIPLLPVLAECEMWGFKIDSEKILEFGEALSLLADELAEKIYETAGEKFNINSPKQLGEIIYEKLHLAPSQRGKHPTDAQTLEEMRNTSPIIDDILEYRHVTKLRGTYTTALTDVADENRRIHTDFKQALTATGRLSSADPNLQNIPIRTKLGRQMRRFFIAEEGYSLIDADYSQIELRLLADISGDYNMCEAFRSGEDIHRKTAAAVFGVPEEYVTDEMRKRAKAVNFGIVYGIGGYSLARDIGTSVAEATKYIKNYLYNYPFVDQYLEQVVVSATERGYTKTPMGRRRYIPELTAAKAPMRAFGKRVAMNAPIQGAAADIMKLAMINVSHAIKAEGLDARIVMQVHDELIVESKDECSARVMEIVKREMEGAASLSLPLTVDVTIGKNWLEQE